MAALPIIWRIEARQDLASVVAFVAEQNPTAARRLRAIIEAAVEPLSAFPFLFRSGRLPGTRELVAHPNYIVIYTVLADRIDILSVIHARRQYP